MEMMTLHDFYEKHLQINDNDLLLDVRTPEEFAEGRIKDSRNISHEKILEYVDDLKQYKQVYIFCRRGARAMTAAQALKRVGMSNITCIYDAGMDLWKESGYPVQQD